MSKILICPSCDSKYEGAPCICEGGAVSSSAATVRRDDGGIPRLRFLLDSIEKFLLSDQTITCNARKLLNVLKDVREAKCICN